MNAHFKCKGCEAKVFPYTDGYGNVVLVSEDGEKDCGIYDEFVPHEVDFGYCAHA